MADAPDGERLPPSLRVLKALVILLADAVNDRRCHNRGLAAFTRMPLSFGAPAPQVPAGLALPEGKTATAVTFGQGWTAVVTTDEHILVFGADGRLRQEVTISPAPGP